MIAFFQRMPTWGRRATARSIGEPDPSGAIGELDRVVLRTAIDTPNGQLPTGTTGTVVTVWSPERAYEVEFTTPIAALVTVDRDLIRRSSYASR